VRFCFWQLTRDIQLLEESGETRQEAVQKFSDGLLRKVFYTELGYVLSFDKQYLE
jgi:hypothetical protein